MTKEERLIRRDRMRYTKNTLSSGLALVAILFNVFYFVSIYKSDVGSYYYQIMIGASIVYNLLFMLVVFLSSEGVKNYKMGYSFVLLIVGILQIARIFIMPLQAYNSTITIMGEEVQVMQTAQFVGIVIYLSVSAVCCIASAVISFIRNCALASHMASLKEKTA